MARHARGAAGGTVDSWQWCAVVDAGEVSSLSNLHRRFQQWVRNGKLVEVLGLLARHLHRRGKLKLDEAFVDATFASANKGASLWARPGAAKAQKSSLSPLAMVFLSPYLSRALRLPSVSLWKLFWPNASSGSCPNDSSVTKHTARTHSTNK